MASLPPEIDMQIRRTIQAGFDRVYCSALDAMWQAEDVLRDLEAAEDEDSPTD